MNTSLDNIPNDPAEQDNNSERKRQRKLPRSGNPAWGVIWRVLLVCAMIDLPFWAYFNFVKGISIWEGLQQMRSGIQSGQPKAKPAWNLRKVSLDEKQKKDIDSVKYAEKLLLEEKIAKHKVEVNQMVQKEMDRSSKKYPNPLYSWKGEDGYRAYSNKGFPENGKYTEGKIDWF